METLFTAAFLGLSLLASPGAASAQTAGTVSVQTAGAVQDLFLEKCANCHGKDGAGQTIKGKKLKVKALSAPEAQKMTDVQMMELLMKGKGDMAPYSKELKAEQMKDLIAYVRTFAKK